MRFSRQTWTAFVSGLLFVATAALLSLVPVPFVVWAPGQVYDVLAGGEQPMLDVSGVTTYPTEGHLDVTTVSVTRADARLTLPEALVSYFLRDRDTLPRDAVYRPGSNAQQVELSEHQQMSDSQTDAIVAALREAGVPVTELPRIGSVNAEGPAAGQLRPGDLVRQVDGRAVRTAEEIRAAIRTRPVGSDLRFTVLRDGRSLTVTVTTGPSNRNAAVAVIGVTFDVGYRHPAVVRFGLDPAVGGPSAGLIFSLGIYDKVTPGPLLGQTTVAGTGTITARGVVGPIGGAREKLQAAEQRGATLFLVPTDNCADLAGVDTTVTLVKVTSLADAVGAVQTFTADPQSSGLNRCLP